MNCETGLGFLERCENEYLALMEGSEGWICENEDLALMEASEEYYEC